MATKKSAKDKALEDIVAMDKAAPEKKSGKTTSSKSKPKATKPPAEVPKEKEDVTWKDAEAVGDKIIIQEKEIQADLDKVIKETTSPTGFDPDDEDAPEPPETEKVRIITTKDIPREQRFKQVSTVVKAKLISTIISMTI